MAALSCYVPHPDKQTHTHTQTETDTETDADTETDKDTDTAQSIADTETQSQIQIQTQTQTQTQTHTHTHTHRGEEDTHVNNVIFVLCVIRETRKLLHISPSRAELQTRVDRFRIWIQKVARKVANRVTRSIFLGF